MKNSINTSYAEHYDLIFYGWKIKIKKFCPIRIVEIPMESDPPVLKGKS